MRSCVPTTYLGNLRRATPNTHQAPGVTLTYGTLPGDHHSLHRGDSYKDIIHEQMTTIVWAVYQPWACMGASVSVICRYIVCLFYIHPDPDASSCHSIQQCWCHQSDAPADQLLGAATFVKSPRFEQETILRGRVLHIVQRRGSGSQQSSITENVEVLCLTACGLFSVIFPCTVCASKAFWQAQ
jgi:hypothetical protein